MTAPELKPCPFCGGEAHLSHKTLDERYGYAMQYEVQCKNCYVGYSFQDDQNPKGGYALDGTGEPKAIAAWNRRADIAAVPAQVRVKPLLWGTFGKECLRAETVLGRYEVMWGFHNGQTSLDIPAPRRSHVWHPSVEAAKTAAQADYESRILAAVEPQPDPRDEVIAWLVDALRNIAEGNLGDAAWQANYARIKDVARAALAAAKAVQK